MRRSQFLSNTHKETPKEAVVTSHVLMLRTCMIKQLAAGIYSYLPLAFRVLRKIEAIIRDELDRAGCQELIMPVVQPADLWIESKRWQQYGKELLRFKDRKENDYCLGPTHEEVITDIVRHEYRSYRELPVNFYQIQTKFRDEIRPRFGLMRGREFIMKDAYSFDVDEAACDKSYWQMYEAYKRIFTRCGLRYRPVEADSGAIGGDYTHEFHVLAGSGEDLILSCSRCEYAANVERCEIAAGEPFRPNRAEVPDPETVATPNVKTIDELAAFLQVAPSECIKTLLYRVDDDRIVGLLVPGDRELNEIAVKNLVGAVEIQMVTDETVFKELGLHPGFLGPVGWPESVPLYADPEVLTMKAAVAGANRKDAHLTGVVPAAHLGKVEIAPLRKARKGDRCPRCESGVFEEYRGIEVGQVFKLGTKYSEAMKAVYLDAEGREKPMVMGCYGLGVGRTMAAAIEQNHDEHGIVWPVQIAPFQVMLLNLDVKDETVTETVEAVYKGLQAMGVETLLDDTALRPGPKFKDADLIGIPLQVRIGARSLEKGTADLKIRAGDEKRSVPVGTVVEEVVASLRSMGWHSSAAQV